MAVLGIPYDADDGLQSSRGGHGRDSDAVDAGLRQGGPDIGLDFFVGLADRGGTGHT